MKRLILLAALIFCTLPVNAATRYFTIQEGIPNMYGTIPTRPFAAFSSCDPYVVKIDGTKYFMMFESGSGASALVGCGGQTKYDLFTPLKYLERDGDISKLTADELKNAGVRFVAQNFDGTLAVNDKNKDFSLDKVSHIDMTRLRITPAAVAYGNFDLYIKKDSGSLKKIIGKVSLMIPRALNRLFP